MKELLLIKMVQEHPVLYNNRRKDFRDNEAKEEAWEDISLKVNASVEDCMRAWKNLRDRYSRERRNMATPEWNSGLFEPEWPLYQTLSYLEPFVHRRRTTAKLLKGDNSPKNNDVFLLTTTRSESPFSNTSLSYYPMEENTDGATTCETTIAGVEKMSKVQIKSEKREKRKRDNEDTAAVLEFVDAVQSSTSKRVNESTINRIDSSFGEYIAESLAEYPRKIKKWAKSQIQHILDQAEELLDRQ